MWEGDMPEIASMARAGSSTLEMSVDQWAPDKGARIRMAGLVLVIYERDEDLSDADAAWLETVLDEYCVTQLPPPAYVAYGPMAGFRRWEVALTPRR